MAKVASKKTVDNNAGLLKTIEGIDRKKVVCVEDFGRFIIVLLKDEAIFHTHIGLEVRCKRGVTNLERPVAARIGLRPAACKSAIARL